MGNENARQGWLSFFNPASSENTAFVAVDGMAIGILRWNGKQASSLSGYTDSLTDSVNPFGGGTGIGPVYGQGNAYRQGSSVGAVTGFTINTVLTISGVRGVVTGVQAVRAAGGFLQVGQVALAGGGVMDLCDAEWPGGGTHSGVGSRTRDIRNGARQPSPEPWRRRRATGAERASFSYLGTPRPAGREGCEWRRNQRTRLQFAEGHETYIPRASVVWTY